MVKHVWIHQGLYGKMTQIAQEYHISRTFLYQLSWAAKHHLADLFSDPQHLVEPPDVLLEPWILLLRLEGKCSRLILDSRVVMGQFWRNKLFLQAFHGGR